MSSLTDKPMARAHEHLASARYAEAAGAFRAVLRIDPNEFRAHFGLADALMARGQVTEAVDGLVAAAEACSEQDDHAAALTLYGKALTIDPNRLELHLDVAMAEAALGRIEAAQGRMEHLAEVYMRSGRTDEAAEVYRCLAGWEAEAEEEEEEYEEEVEEYQGEDASTAAYAALPAGVGAPVHVPTTETVVVPTILVTPDGQLLQMPMDRQPAPGPSVRKVKIEEDPPPPIPAELMEVAQSAPIDVDDEEDLDDVEGTVVAYPPPPPVLPEEDAGVDRSDLEAAVVAALDNLAQLEEEDMTLVMQRLPPQPKKASMRRRLAGESRLPEFITNSHLRKPEIPKREPVGGGKLRVRPAPRPVGEAPESAPAPEPARRAPARAAAPSQGRGNQAPRGGAPGPARGAPPRGDAPPARAGGRGPAPGRPGPAARPAPGPRGGPPPARAAAPGRAAPAKGAPPSQAPNRAAPPSRGAAPSRAPAPSKAPPRSPAPASAARPSKPKPSDVPPPGTTTGARPVRPNNPLAERLRRRAGLTGPQQAVSRSGKPRSTSSRATEPITVRSPKFEKKKR